MTSLKQRMPRGIPKTKVVLPVTNGVRTRRQHQQQNTDNISEIDNDKIFKKPLPKKKKCSKLSNLSVGESPQEEFQFQTSFNNKKMRNDINKDQPNIWQNDFSESMNFANHKQMNGILSNGKITLGTITEMKSFRKEFSEKVVWLYLFLAVVFTQCSQIVLNSHIIYSELQTKHLIIIRASWCFIFGLLVDMFTFKLVFQFFSYFWFCLICSVYWYPQSSMLSLILYTPSFLLISQCAVVSGFKQENYVGVLSRLSSLRCLFLFLPDVYNSIQRPLVSFVRSSLEDYVYASYFDSFWEFLTSEELILFLALSFVVLNHILLRVVSNDDYLYRKPKISFLNLLYALAVKICFTFPTSLLITSLNNNIPKIEKLSFIFLMNGIILQGIFAPTLICFATHRFLMIFGSSTLVILYFAMPFLDWGGTPLVTVPISGISSFLHCIVTSFLLKISGESISVFCLLFSSHYLLRLFVDKYYSTFLYILSKLSGSRPLCNSPILFFGYIDTISNRDRINCRGQNSFFDLVSFIKGNFFTNNSIELEILFISLTGVLLSVLLFFLIYFKRIYIKVF